MSFDIILTAAPQDTRAAQALSRRVAHLAYSVGPGLVLLRGSIGSSMRGGYMVLSDDGYDHSTGDMSALCRDVLHECGIRGYQGVVADFEQTGPLSLAPFVEQCAPALKERGLKLFVSLRYASISKDSWIIIPTALVAGSLKERLRKARERFGPQLAIEIERMARDITLPDSEGQGRRLEKQELQQLASERQVFFSGELCSHYFTYKDRENGQTHFVLYDDAQSILKKIHLAVGMGIAEGFLLYPEAADIWNELTEPSPAVI